MALKNTNRFQHFDDYLNSLDSDEKSWISEVSSSSTPAPTTSEEDDSDEDDLSDEWSDRTTTTTTTTPPPTTPRPTLIGVTALPKNREVTCCLLGQLAGDKGYHCYVQYYAARLIMRNRNRAHNRKMSFYGRDRIPNYGLKVMRTFEQCVAGYGAIFHKCCHLANNERQSGNRYDSVQRSRYDKKRERTNDSIQD